MFYEVEPEKYDLLGGGGRQGRLLLQYRQLSSCNYEINTFIKPPGTQPVLSSCPIQSIAWHATSFIMKCQKSISVVMLMTMKLICRGVPGCLPLLCPLLSFLLAVKIYHNLIFHLLSDHSQSCQGHPGVQTWYITSSTCYPLKTDRVFPVKFKLYSQPDR